MYSIRLSNETDSSQVITIFNYFIENSMAAYPQSPLPVQAFSFLKSKCINGNLLVAESENKEVVGFALLKSFMEMDTFSFTADVGDFIAPEHQGKGLGKQLLNALEEKAKALGIKVLVASVSSMNYQSIAFHEHSGFTKCGELPEVGQKLGNCFGIIWFYKKIS